MASARSPMDTYACMARFAFLAALLFATAVDAAEGTPSHPALQDRFYFGGGWFSPQITTNASLASRAGIGANVDFENALGMEDSTSAPMGMARWRITDRWRFEAEYFRLNRSGSRVIDRNIQWGDQTYAINSQVNSTFNFSDLRLSAGYSFFRRPDKEVGVGAGLHVARYSASLESTAAGRESTAATAPLPVISFFSQFALTDRWALGARMDRFFIKYDNFQGSLVAVGVDLLYQPFRHVGFGLGSRALYLDATNTDDGRKASFRQTFQGPVVFVNVSF